MLWHTLAHWAFVVRAAEAMHFAFLATHAAAQATPFLGAKQLRKAVSYWAWQVAGLASMLQAF